MVEEQSANKVDVSCQDFTSCDTGYGCFYKQPTGTMRKRSFCVVEGMKVPQDIQNSRRT